MFYFSGIDYFMMFTKKMLFTAGLMQRNMARMRFSLVMFSGIIAL